MTPDEKALDDALADTFPASDPIACSNPSTTSRNVPVRPAVEMPQPQPHPPSLTWRVVLLASFAVGYLLTRRRRI